jgi:hypothetical protein
VNTYALIFYILTFSFVGNPNDMVIKHNLESWKHPYLFESKQHCEEIAKAIRLQQPNPNNLGYKHLCEPVTKDNLTGSL